MLLTLLAALPCSLQDAEPARPLEASDVAAAGRLIGVPFTDSELELMLSGVRENLGAYAALRAVELRNSDPPALGFAPRMPAGGPRIWTPPAHELALPEIARPADLAELAYADIATLAALVRTRRVSCVELAATFLARLRRLDAELHCVITFTEERALAQARALDAELAAGKWRGPLHGIPWGAKDLLATRGIRTTWGAEPFEQQVLDYDAAVVERLDAAGAVLIAKLTLGALAWGDVWFGGMTRNPWNPEQGSSGSSAGSAAAVAAGGVVFAIGSETLGSIVSPSDRCGATALRPTFGRVSRHGAMALSWSMDKLGPLCRSAADAALVFDAIQGRDARDPSTTDQPFAVPGPVPRAELAKWRVGYLAQAFEEAPHLYSVLDELTALGAQLVEVELPSYPTGEMLIVLSAEAATAFDELTRDGQDDLLARQVEQAWPNVFRVSRLIPAVEYLRANRVRALLARDMEAVMETVDLYVHPSFGGESLAITNLTGHPTVVAPAGFRPSTAEGSSDFGPEAGGAPDAVLKEVPFSVSFTGRLWDEARLLSLVRAWQDATRYHLRHPGP